jgi:hypothetical protein
VVTTDGFIFISKFDCLLPKEAEICSCVKPSAKARLVIDDLVIADSRIKVIEQKILQIKIQDINQAARLITNTGSPYQ